MTYRRGWVPGGWKDWRLSAHRTAHPLFQEVDMTKAQEVYEKVEALVAAGTSKAEAFKQLAENEYNGQPVNSLRGAYYQHTKAMHGESGAQPRRRETTPEDALADARKSLERAIENIDREVEAAKVRAEEAKAEYDSLRASAAERKKTIQAHLEALK